ncbi:MAG TPA: glucose-6-phosphate isomerase, partial [Spirochaetia bacterium]|nr:glucose-6-phosphate isomerase [Spirochaetia bacterium]
FNYAAAPVDEAVIERLSDLAAEQELIPKYKALVKGEVMNTGEKRMVLHHLVRGQLSSDVIHEGKNLRSFYEEQRTRIAAFAEKVKAGTITGSTGKRFTTVVQIGIGGSDLGPRALYLSLKDWVREQNGKVDMEARFISNVDPDDANAVLSGIDFERTLFILVTKSGTTQETLTNLAFVREKMKKAGIKGLDPSKHIIAVTSETSPLAGSKDYLDAFFIDDFIGGRYSATSAVGGVILSLALGSDIFERILEGAHEADRIALSGDIRKNPALMDAMIGVYERNVLGMPATAILPYSQALSRFPAHLQQLDMESNGKSVNRDGRPLSYPTGPVIFGEPGTNGQHSFYQLLHQGTDIIPLQFIGFRKAQSSFDIDYEGSKSQTKLKANLAAQIAAFALGKSDSNPNKNFPGRRPSTLIHGESLTPEALGALLSHYENKVMFQGFAWNINSFDQEGVQLGKVLTQKILAKGADIDPVLEAYGRILGV